MRTIQFKLSEHESDTFDMVREKDGTKLSPKKFFLLAVKREVDKIMAEATDESSDDDT